MDAELSFGQRLGMPEIVDGRLQGESQVEVADLFRVLLFHRVLGQQLMQDEEPAMGIEFKRNGFLLVVKRAGRSSSEPSSRKSEWPMSHTSESSFTKPSFMLAWRLR